MIKLGIIGYPLGHSLSPIMHKSALDYLGIDGSYEALETEPEDIVSRIKYLKVNGFKGFNVTIPLKVPIIAFLLNVDDYANIAGAVNTVVIDDNKNLLGYNTDIYGFIESIPIKTRLNLKSKKAGVFGSGGAARAIAVGLAEMGVDEITFFARNRQKAMELTQIIESNYLNTKVYAMPFIDDMDLSEFSIVVNTTPLGMEGLNELASPVSKHSIGTLPQDAVVYDLIYKPKETWLLKYAKDFDLTTIDGSEMLILQGAKAFELWTKETAPVDIMRKAVISNL